MLITDLSTPIRDSLSEILHPSRVSRLGIIIRITWRACEDKLLALTMEFLIR